MEKLEEIISDLMIEYGPDGHCDGADVIAQEAKKLAIEFLGWIREYEGDSWLGEKYRLELFDKFINKYYESTKTN